MSVNVWSSAIIEHPIDRVWALLRPLDFVWNPRVQAARTSADRKTAVGPWLVGDAGTVTYIDGTTQTLRLTELSDVNHTLSYEIVASEPAVTYSSVSHSIRLRRVTTPVSATFIEWDTHFSKDADNNVIEDARFKQTDAFSALRNEASKKFTFHSTAEDVVKGAPSANVKGRTFVVTGGNSGIGYETVRALAAGGAHVVFTTRDEKKAKETEAELKKANPNAKVEGMVCALDSFKSIRAFAEAYTKKGYPLNVLINNAGIMATPYAKTEDGFESQFGTNHIGHYLLTTLLLPVLKKSQPARIVALSSAAHRRGDINWDDVNFTKPNSYDGWASYGQSKTANILFANHLNALLKKEGVKITVNSVHPGVIMTNLSRYLPGGAASFFPPPSIGKDGKEEKKATPAVLTPAAGYVQPNPVKAGPPSPLAPVSFTPRMKTIPQGAASTVAAAVLEPYGTEGGLYFIDCNPVTPLPHAADLKAAERLWALTEKLVAGVKA